MRFEWDERKNRSNIRRHGIDFADVPSVFGHPMLVGLDTRENYGEDRWIGVGLLRDVVVVVVYAEPNEETVRIISARKATRNEAQRYQESLPY